MNLIHIPVDMPIQKPPPPPPPVSIASLKGRADYVASLLKQCKETYGWAALRAMNSKELTLLLRRSVPESSPQETVWAFDPLFQYGLLELLSTPRKRRQNLLQEMAARFHSTSSDVEELISLFDQQLKLGRAELREEQFNTQPADRVSPAAWQRYRWSLLSGGLLLIAAAGISIGIQLYKTQTDLARQKENSQQQEKDIESLKQKLAEQKKKEKQAMNPLPSGTPGVAKPVAPPAATIPDPAPRLPSTPSRVDRLSSLRWDGCDQSNQPVSEPRQGDQWWPVVAPSSALESVRNHCRGDAFINRDGNVQVASFNNRARAAEWARRVSMDNSHPYQFWVGESTIYGVEP